MESKITREIVNKPIIDIINSDVFDNDAERGIVSEKDYQIPDRQRYPRWDKKDWPLLIDSIMSNYPMPNFLMTQEISAGRLVHFIQDGQTRLSIAQDYVKGKYTWNSKKYSELDCGEKSRLDNYLVTVTIVKKKPTTSNAEFRGICRDIFERVNKGKPLTDNDKFHNCKDEPLLKLIMRLKVEPEFCVAIKEIFGDVGGERSKTRIYLANMVGLVLAIMLNDPNLFRASYDKNAHYLFAEDDSSVVIITEEKYERVKEFFRWYFALAKTIKDTSEFKLAKGLLKKPSGVLALVLTDWLDGIANNRREMWVDYAVKINKDNKYERRVFRSLSKGVIQNNTHAGFKARIKCVVAAYEKRNADTVNGDDDDDDNKNDNEDDDEYESSEDQDPDDE